MHRKLITAFNQKFACAADPNKLKCFKQGSDKSLYDTSSCYVDKLNGTLLKKTQNNNFKAAEKAKCNTGCTVGEESNWNKTENAEARTPLACQRD